MCKTSLHLLYVNIELITPDHHVVSDTSILHHAFISIFIAFMGCYYTLCHNTYAYSLLFYKVYMKRENADSWDSRLEKEQILETYYAQLQKS